MVSGHEHVCIIEFIKQVKDNVKYEASLSISYFFCQEFNKFNNI